MLKYLNTDGLENKWSYIWTKQSKESLWYELNGEYTDILNRINNLKLNEDVYWSVSIFDKPTKPHLRGKAQDSVGIWGLWLDVDMRSPYRKRRDLPSNVNESLMLIDDSPFPPTLIISSGYGLQPWWLFKEPWIFNSQAEKLEASKICGAWNEWFRIKALNKGWGLDGVSDLARVMRYPGTLNHKGPQATEVFVLKDSDIYYDAQELSEMIPEEAWCADRGVHDPALAVDITLNHGAEVDTPMFTRLCANIDQFAATWTHKKKLSDSSMSGYDLSIASYCVMGGLKDQEICDMLVAHAKNHNAEVKTQAYYERTIAKARQGGKIGVKPEEIHDVNSVIPLLTDINAGGKEEVQNRKNEVLSLLSMIFKLQVYDFIAYTTDPREYELVTDKGRVKLHNGSDDLVSGNAFRKRVGDITSIYIDRFKTVEWDIIAQALRFVAREIDLGEDVSEESQTIELLRSYLNTKPAMPEERGDEAKLVKRPFYEGGSLKFFLDDFRLWLSTRGERTTQPRLAAKFRRAGLESENTYSGEGKTRRRHIVWRWSE